MKGYYTGEVNTLLYNDLIIKSTDLHDYLVNKQKQETLSKEEIDWAKSFYNYAQDILKIVEESKS